MNATHSLLVGGYPDPSGTWSYNWTSQTWTATGDLNANRTSHGCALLKDKGVLIVGGYNEGTAELYDPNTGVSIVQPVPPPGVGLDQPLLLEWNNTVIAMFERETEIYEYMEDGSWTVLQGARLPETNGRNNQQNKAVLVPDSFALGCL